jgi:CheY-like chemotaxis protein
MTKILVADDDTVMLGLLRTLMKLEGNEIVTVTRPEEILPAIEKEKPALLLMDNHLAGGDSIDVLNVMKSSPKLKDIPVLVTSGMDRQTECLEAGADGFILKPFRPSQLIEYIQDIVGDQ